MRIKKNILSKGTLKIVGSILRKSPRDLDVALVLSDKEFEKEFKLTPKQWMLQGDNGNWSKQRWKWSDITISSGKILERRILKALKRYPIDLKIIPESYDKTFKEKSC